MDRIFQKRIDGFDLSCNKSPGIPAPQTLPGQIAAKKSCQLWRYYIATLVFIGLFMVNLQRMGMAVAVVSMAKSTSGRSTTQNYTSVMSCPAHYNTSQDPNEHPIEGEFDWNPQLQGFILGAAFLGFSFGSIAGGTLADKYGAKRTIFWGNTVAAVGMLFCPIFSWLHAYSLIVLQLVRGIAQGIIAPSAYTVMAKWTPRSERSFISSLILTGFYTGSMSGGLVAGSICENPFLGWRSFYYITGAVGALFSLLFIMTFYETPNDHPRISEAERKYIIEDQETMEKGEIPPTPWLKILTSVPTYALMFGMLGFYWKVFYFLSVHPAYLRNILHYSILKSGFLASIPFLTKIIGSLAGSAFADWLYRRKYVGIDKIRRGCTLIGCSGFSFSMLGLYLAKCNELLNVLFESTALMSAGIVTSGAVIAAVDMAPNYAATLIGVISSVASTCGFIIPVVVGYMTKDQTLEGWQNVFFLNMGAVMTCGVFFAAFGSAEIQPWNDIDESKKAPSGVKNNPSVTNDVKDDVKDDEC